MCQFLPRVRNKLYISLHYTIYLLYIYYIFLSLLYCNFFVYFLYFTGLYRADGVNWIRAETELVSQFYICQKRVQPIGPRL